MIIAEKNTNRGKNRSSLCFSTMENTCSLGIIIPNIVEKYWTTISENQPVLPLHPHEIATAHENLIYSAIISSGRSRLWRWASKCHGWSQRYRRFQHVSMVVSMVQHNTAMVIHDSDHLGRPPWLRKPAILMGKAEVFWAQLNQWHIPWCASWNTSWTNPETSGFKRIVVNSPRIFANWLCV